MLLYRTIWYEAVLKRYALPRYEVNDIVEFKNISSTAINPYEEDDGSKFYRYEIIVPKNRYVLELDEYKEYSKRWWAKGEVILPPMKCRVKNIRNSDNEKCMGVIELEYIEKLPVNIDTNYLCFEKKNVKRIIEKYFSIDRKIVQQMIEATKNMSNEKRGDNGFQNTKTFLFDEYAVLKMQNMNFRNVTTEDMDLKHLERLAKILLDLKTQGINVVPILAFQ